MCDGLNMFESYYDILECSSDATCEEIKRSYQKLVKKFHPDKSTCKSHQQFIKIDKAWKTLSDAELKRQYDTSLLQLELTSSDVVYATLNVNELEFDDTSKAYYPCRCGCFYCIVKDIADEHIVECTECSYVIVVKANVKK